MKKGKKKSVAQMATVGKTELGKTSVIEQAVKAEPIAKPAPQPHNFTHTVYDLPGKPFKGGAK